jgi:hypothetical protein
MESSLVTVHRPNRYSGVCRASGVFHAKDPWHSNVIPAFQRHFDWSVIPSKITTSFPQKAPDLYGRFSWRSADQEFYGRGPAVSFWFWFARSTGIQSWFDLFSWWVVIPWLMDVCRQNLSFWI